MTSVCLQGITAFSLNRLPSLCLCFVAQVLCSDSPVSCPALAGQGETMKAVLGHKANTQ